MTEKLSDFTASTPGLNDYVAGATLGAPNKRFLASSFGFPSAGANLTFYVATTGSDSNPGSLVAPFATVQHAINVAQSFNYGAQWNVTINVADGTYSESPQVTFPQLNPGGSGANISIIGDHATPANCIIHFFSFSCFGTIVALDGFEFSSSGGIFGSAGQLNYGNLSFTGAPSQCFNLFGTGITLEPINNPVIDLSACTSVGQFIETADAGGTIVFFGCHFTFPVALPASGFIFGDFLLLEWAGNTYTNFAGVSGSSGFIGPYLQLTTDNGLPTDIPGNGIVGADNTAQWVKSSTGATGQGIVNTGGGVPVASNLPAGTWGVFFDPTGNKIYLTTNKAGVVTNTIIG